MFFLVHPDGKKLEIRADPTTACKWITVAQISQRARGRKSPLHILQSRTHALAEIPTKASSLSISALRQSRATAGGTERTVSAARARCFPPDRCRLPRSGPNCCAAGAARGAPAAGRLPQHPLPRFGEGAARARCFPFPCGAGEARPLWPGAGLGGTSPEPRLGWSESDLLPESGF